MSQSTDTVHTEPSSICFCIHSLLLCQSLSSEKVDSKAVHKIIPIFMILMVTPLIDLNIWKGSLYIISLQIYLYPAPQEPTSRMMYSTDYCKSVIYVSDNSSQPFISISEVKRNLNYCKLFKVIHRV